jgi:uncharacterized protein YjbI with pentapeptide repeats
VAITTTVMHLVIPLHRLSWRSKMALGLGAALVGAGVIAGVGAPRRPFDLFRANLADQWLAGRDLKKAFLSLSNLKGATLSYAHLDGADLTGAHLEGADLRAAHLESADLQDAHLDRADLTRAHLEGADLQDAHLEGADLRWAYLDGADLSEADGLTQAQIYRAYGDANTKLPEGLTRPAHWTASAP